MKNKKIRIPALIVFAILLLCVVILFFQQKKSSSSDLSALIYQDDKLLREIDLTNVNEPYTFTVETSDGGYNTIQVEEGQIGIIDANCPDKICERMGMIHTSTFPIACLPHKLLVEIKSNDNAGDSLDSMVQ